MSQSDVLLVLKKHKKPLSAAEIAIELKDQKSHVGHCIKGLIKSREINIIEINREQAMKFYHSKRRMRLYYVKKV